MISEKEMEDIIAANPEKYIGETGLSLVARQYKIGKYIFDLLFQDRHGAKLIIELQIGALDRNHTYKIMDYYHEYKDRNPNDFIELMIIANTIPLERKNRLKQWGISFKEIPESDFIENLEHHKRTIITSKKDIKNIQDSIHKDNGKQTINIDYGQVIEIPSSILDRACKEIIKEFGALPFKHRSILITRDLIKATLEILNSVESRTMPQNCRNDIRARTPDGLDKRIKESLNIDLRTANIISDILERVNIAKVVSMDSKSSSRKIKGTELMKDWSWE